MVSSDLCTSKMAIKASVQKYAYLTPVNRTLLSVFKCAQTAIITILKQTPKGEAVPP